MNSNHLQSRACLRYGWTALAVFLSFGLVLESLHLFKTAFYFEVHIRRELWTLAHAHGALLALLNILFAMTMDRCFTQQKTAVLAARCMRVGAMLVPVGFLLGGWQTYESDPGLWIFLVPVGALLILTSVILASMGAWVSKDSQG